MNSKLRDQIVWLDITSFVGYAGQHYYGKLVYTGGDERKQLDLERPLTKTAAAALNKKDGYEHFAWKAGDMNGRLNSRESVKQIAIEKWKEFAPDALMLVNASSGLAQPMEVLAGFDAEQLRELNVAWFRYEEYVYDDGPNGRWDATTEELETAWELLLTKFTEVRA